MSVLTRGKKDHEWLTAAAVAEAAASENYAMLLKKYLLVQQSQS